MYTDVHCHLNFTEYGNVGETISKIRKAGVDLVVTSGFDMESSFESAKIAEENEGVFFSAGWQPQELSKLRDEDLDRLKELCLHKKCVAVGEIGLDYHYPDNPDKAFQKDVLVKELELAKELSLPVVVHSRDCAEDMLRVMRDNKEKLTAGGVLHCYSHSSEMIADFLDLGFYFSFGGSSTFKGNKKVSRSVKATPSDRILSETDSPYLTPEPLRGVFPNTPANIPLIVRNMAALRGEEEERLAEQIRENTLALFQKVRRPSKKPAADM